MIDGLVFQRVGVVMLLMWLAAGAGCSPAAESGRAGGDDIGGSGNAETSSASDQVESARPQRATLVLAGGCFWCVEAVFEELEGVEDAISGYAGGTRETANYQAVSSGRTQHAEAVQINYDPSKISYEELLEVHFATHDPTTLNRQGADVGPQYRSTIFYPNEKEKRAAESYIRRLRESGVFRDPIVTTLEPLVEFFPAEHYHQNYVCENPNQRYVEGVAWPKVEKVRKQFKDRLKEQSPLGR